MCLRLNKKVFKIKGGKNDNKLFLIIRLLICKILFANINDDAIKLRSKYHTHNPTTVLHFDCFKVLSFGSENLWKREGSVRLLWMFKQLEVKLRNFDDTIIIKSFIGSKGLRTVFFPL